MTISQELLDELLSCVERSEDLLRDKGLMKELKVRLMERMLGAELTAHLGLEPHGEPTNRRNGATRKLLNRSPKLQHYLGFYCPFWARLSAP
jgi:putative transposase